ncbi:MAG: FAD-binding oxidoreductase [archaeon]
MGFKSRLLYLKEYASDGKNITKVARFERHGMPYSAGQFAMLGMDGFDWKEKPGQMKWNSMSIASSPEQKDYLEFTIGIKPYFGFSQAFDEKMKVGDIINIRGPFGKFVLNEKAKRIVLVATGTGIAPIMGMLRTIRLKKLQMPVTFFYGFRNSEFWVYREELKEMAFEMKNLEYLPSKSRPEAEWQGLKGHIQQHILSREFTDVSETEAYLCGNPEMVKQTVEALKQKGFAEENCFREVYG